MTTPTTGQTIRGTYCGFPFAGIVRSSRSHTMNWNLVVVYVELSAPIEVHGRVEREAISLMTPRERFTMAEDGAVLVAD